MDERRTHACQAPVAATLAWIENRHQELYETLETAAEQDRLGLAYRLTNVAAMA
jgi:hypothetical protein